MGEPLCTYKLYPRFRNLSGNDIIKDLYSNDYIEVSID